MLDLKIEGGTVIDGTGTVGRRADVWIRDDTIVAVGDLSREPAGRQLRALGKADDDQPETVLAGLVVLFDEATLLERCQ